MICIERIYKNYKNGDDNIQLYEDFSLKIKDGEIIALVGPSGCGKSTLLNIISGIDKPDSGRILFEDKSIFDLKDKEISNLRLQKFGFIFQDFNLLSTLCVLDNILVPLLASKKKYEMEEVMDLCRKLGLDERLYHYPHQLSGGEKQRVAIARALINRPKVIFSDEATGNLDKKNSTVVMDMLVNCCKQFGASLIYVTHDMELTHYADRVINIDKGDNYEEN